MLCEGSGPAAARPCGDCRSCRLVQAGFTPKAVNALEPVIQAHAAQVIDELDRLARIRGKPRSIRVDNGPEFAGRLLDQWAYLNKVELDFSRPGKPTDNAYIEAFNSRLRQESLNASWFLSMDDARNRINDWRADYNETRPHSSLGNLTPSEFAAQLNETRKVA